MVQIFCFRKSFWIFSSKVTLFFSLPLTFFTFVPSGYGLNILRYLSLNILCNILHPCSAVHFECDPSPKWDSRLCTFVPQGALTIHSKCIGRNPKHIQYNKYRKSIGFYSKLNMVWSFLNILKWKGPVQCLTDIFCAFLRSILRIYDGLDHKDIPSRPSERNMADTMIAKCTFQTRLRDWRLWPCYQKNKFELKTHGLGREPQKTSIYLIIQVLSWFGVVFRNFCLSNIFILISWTTTIFNWVVTIWSVRGRL